MKVHVCFVQNDLMNHETKIISDCIALLNDNHLLYKEDEADAKHSITFSPEAIILERIAEVSSRTVLKHGEEGETVVNSPYGVMHFTARLQSSEQTELHWKVHYAIYSEEEQISEMELEWKFDKLA
jgi:hypothetical protein